MSETNLSTALGPLAALYVDPKVTEIMVDNPQAIWVERAGRLESAGVHFESAGQIRSVVDALLALSGDMADPQAAIVQIHFPDHQARAVAIFPPVAPNGPCLVIRKLVLGIGVTWEKLIEWRSVTQETYDFLQAALRVPVNILVSGGTGSGKTTITNRIVELIPEDQRIVVVENAHEMLIRHPRTVFLEAGGTPRISMTELISTGSMMRPDWLVVGELIGPEAMRAIEVMGRGHSAITNLHANSCEDALARLEAMCLMANLGLGLGEIRTLITAALQLILHQRRLPDGSRKIVEIVELGGLQNGRYLLQPLFRFNLEANLLERTGLKASWE